MESYFKIREIRKQKRVTQEQLAQYLGVNRATISKYEAGIIVPPIQQLGKIAQVLNVSILDLLQDYVHVKNDLGETDVYLRDLNGVAENMLRTGGVPLKAEMLFTGKNPDFESALAKVISGEAEDQETIERLLTAFNKLDFWGQQVAVDLVETLSSNPSFQRKDQQQSDNLQAETRKTKKDPLQD